MSFDTYLDQDLVSLSVSFLPVYIHFLGVVTVHTRTFFFSTDLRSFFSLVLKSATISNEEKSQWNGITV